MTVHHRLEKELDALGVSSGHVRCLLLLPQVYVGWASQQRDLPALEALLNTTVHRAKYGRACLDLARAWLFEEPTRAQFQSGFALLTALRRTSHKPLVVMSDVLESMLWACWAARLDREPAQGNDSPSPRSVTSAGRRALAELEVLLEIETRDLWSDFLREGGDDLAVSSNDATQSIDVLPTVEREYETALLDVSEDEERSAVLLLIEDGATPTSDPFHQKQAETSPPIQERCEGELFT
jgi:hypothetical protein